MAKKKPTPKSKKKPAADLTSDEAMERLFSKRVVREIKREVKRLDEPVTDHKHKTS